MNKSHNNLNLIEDIKARELFYQTTDHNHTVETKGTYCGFDATALSLQIGNLLCLSLLRLFDKHKVKTIAVLGGATTSVGGDPTWKNDTRNKLDANQVEKNIEVIEKQIKSLIPNAKIMNNANWLEQLKFLDFIEHIASTVSVSAHLKLETFANRLQNNNPLNMQELLYPLMQGYDFLWLYENEGCNVECGGADQWCNILAGIELIKKKHENPQIIGMTLPLLTTPNGEKMGKSVNGAVYLNPDMYSPYNFWQFWRNIDDSIVKPCLKKFTLIDIQEIDNMNDINQAKIILANDLTTWIHGSETSKAAQAQATSVFIEKNLDELEANKVSSNKLIEIMVEIKACETKSQAKTLIEQAAVKINEQVIKDKTHKLEAGQSTLSVGKKKFYKIIVK